MNRNLNHLIGSLIVASGLALAATTEAATIIFTQQGFSSDSLLSTDGSLLVAAINLGTTTDVTTTNGIVFDGDTDGSYTANGMTIGIFNTPSAQYANAVNGGYYTGLDVAGAGTQTLLDTLGYANGDNGEVLLSGLTINKRYEVQLLIVDEVDTGRTVDVLSGSSGGIPTATDITAADYTDRSDGYALLVTGTFTADATTQSLYLEAEPKVSGFHYSRLNAMQLRVVPEPSSTALLGLGGLALMLRRKRS